MSERLDALSLSLSRLTVVVLDNASVHKKAVKERWAVWQERGLFVFFLPAYSPHLNIAEILWRKLKYEWLCPEDYADMSGYVPKTTPTKRHFTTVSGRRFRRWGDH